MIQKYHKTSFYNLVTQSLLLITLASCNSSPKSSLPPASSLSDIHRDSICRAVKDRPTVDPKENINPTNANRFIKPIYIRESEIATSNAKFNGEAVVIEMEIPASVLKAHPDTLKKEVRQNYANSERFFPRSIADDFQKGISTEQISYPHLNYTVRVYENEFAAKPYTTQTFRAWKHALGHIVVE